MDDSDAAYRVDGAAGRYEVRSRSGMVTVVCTDEDNARHYALLLNQAWRAGYKAGYRAARRA